MFNVALAGLGWWGKNIVNAVQGKCAQLRFVRGVTKEIAETQAFAARLREAVGVPVIMQDERLSTAEAERAMVASHIRRRRRRDPQHQRDASGSRGARKSVRKARGRLLRAARDLTFGRHTNATRISLPIEARSCLFA